MPTYKVQNIIVGAAALYVSAIDSTSASWVQTGATPVVGALGPAFPTETANTTVLPALDAATTNWRSAGFTSEGVEVSYEPQFGDIEVDQLLDSAKLFKQSMRVMVNTTFTEATLENLLVIWGQQNATLSGSTLGISSGELGDEPVERSLVFVGPAPRTASTNKKQERVYHCHRALSVESTSYAMRRNEPTTLPVSFRILPDPIRSAKQYGYVKDRQIEV